MELFTVQPVSNDVYAGVKALDVPSHTDGTGIVYDPVPTDAAPPTSGGKPTGGMATSGWDTGYEEPGGSWFYDASGDTGWTSVMDETFGTASLFPWSAGNPYDGIGDGIVVHSNTSSDASLLSSVEVVFHTGTDRPYYVAVTPGIGLIVPQTQVSEDFVEAVTVTAPRYDPNDPNFMNQLASHAGEPLRDDTLAALAAMAYKLDPNAPWGPAGFNLQNKVIMSNGLYAAVYQRSGSNDYIFVYEGSFTSEAKLESTGIVLGINTAASTLQLKSWLQNVTDNIMHNDPWAHIYNTGHSLGGADAIMASSLQTDQIIAGGAHVSVHTVALAPFHPEAIISIAEASPRGLWENYIHSYWATDDILQTGSEVYGHTTWNKLNPTYPDGTIMATSEAHDVSRYVRSIPGY